MQGLREQQVFGITNAFSRIGGAMRWLLPYFENPDISNLFMLKKVLFPSLTMPSA